MTLSATPPLHAWSTWMILLDINVISEPLRRQPEKCVIQWLDTQPIEILYLTAITVAELRAGIALLPKGKRRTFLQENLEGQVLPMFTGRVLAFDLTCTPCFAQIIAHTRQHGQTIAAADSYIAAIAATHRFTVATRDTAPFIAARVPVINPWEVPCPVLGKKSSTPT